MWAWGFFVDWECVASMLLPLIAVLSLCVEENWVHGKYLRPGEEFYGCSVNESQGGASENLLIEQLTGLAGVEFYFDNPIQYPPAPQASTPFFCDFNKQSAEATPDDPSQWYFRKFTDHRVLWVYRITDEDYGVAVKQEEERKHNKD